MTFGVMTMSKLVDEQAKFLLDMCRLIWEATERGFKVTGGELYRTAEQQAIYLKTGKSKTSNSRHLSRLAIDLNFFKNDVLVSDKKTLQEIGDFWESMNPQNKWGGNYKSFLDIPHFERLP